MPKVEEGTSVLVAEDVEGANRREKGELAKEKAARECAGR